MCCIPALEVPHRIHVASKDYSVVDLTNMAEGLHERILVGIGLGRACLAAKVFSLVAICYVRACRSADAGKVRTTVRGQKNTMSRRVCARSMQWLWLSGLIVLADQASKQAVTALLPPFRPLAVMPSLNFLLAYNSGISFSFLDGPNNWQRWPLSLLGVVAVSGVIIWLLNVRRRQVLLGTAMSCRAVLPSAVADRPRKKQR
jgi:hypothetical protein